MENDKPSPIIGIVDRLQGPMNSATGLSVTIAQNLVLSPYRFDCRIQRLRRASAARAARFSDEGRRGETAGVG